MGRHDRADGMRAFDDDRDSAIAELLRRAYARKVGLDTAARQLWAVDRAARSLRRSRRAARARRTVVAALASLMLIGTGGGAIAASAGALPGDALYAIKRGTEEIRLVLALTPAADARMHLTIARTRWAEAQQVVEDRPDMVPSLLGQTFAALDEAERPGGQTADRALALRSQVTAGSAELAFGPTGPAAQAGPRTDADRAPEDPASPPPARAPVDSRDQATGETGTAGRSGEGGSAPDAQAPDAAPRDAEAGDADAGGGQSSETVALSPPPVTAPPTPRVPPAPTPTPEAITAAPPAPAAATPSPEATAPPPDGNEPVPADPGGDTDAPAPTQPTEEYAQPGRQKPRQPGPVPAGAPSTEAEPAPSAPPAPGWGRPRPSAD
ncbi:MAG: DUF5667 domain-containing protein [Egibacteraceae bacterium]